MSLARLSLLVGLVASAWSPAAIAVENLPTAPAPRAELPNPLAVIGFTTGSARVSRDARDDLASVVRWLRAHPDRMLYIEGHADRTGDRASNLTLSQQRSDAVRDQLIRMGANPDQLVQVGFGELAGTDLRPAREVVLRASSDDFGDLMGAQRSRQRAPARENNPERESRDQDQR